MSLVLGPYGAIVVQQVVVYWVSACGGPEEIEGDSVGRGGTLMWSEAAQLLRLQEEVRPCWLSFDLVYVGRD